MKYEIQLICSGEAWDTREVKDDNELFLFLGRFAVWYFLALDGADYKDAYVNGQSAPDALLAFTCDKATDTDFAHGRRHGLPTHVLAYGHAWPCGRKEEAKIVVNRKAEGAQ